MTLTKLVNGVRINLTPEEEIRTRAKWDANRLRKEEDKRESGYLRDRREKYPPIEEQIQAIFAGFKKMKNDGDILDPLTAAWVAQIEAINAMHPAPA